VGPAQGNECRVGTEATVVAASDVFSASIEMRGRVARDGKSEPRGEKSSGGDQGQRNISEERRNSSCRTKTKGNRKECVGGCWKVKEEEGRDEATLLIKCFRPRRRFFSRPRLAS